MEGVRKRLTFCRCRRFGTSLLPVNRKYSIANSNLVKKNLILKKYFAFQKIETNEKLCFRRFS